VLARVTLSTRRAYSLTVRRIQIGGGKPSRTLFEFGTQICIVRIARGLPRASTVGYSHSATTVTPKHLGHYTEFRHRRSLDEYAEG
jgi:hypothetical protein